MLFKCLIQISKFVIDKGVFNIDKDIKEFKSFPKNCLEKL